MSESLSHLSPTEVAVLFADRVLPSTNEHSWGGWRVVRSRRKVAVDGVALLALDTLVAALVAGGATELTLRQRKGMIKWYEVAHLRLLPGVKPSVFPHQSPEARVVAWLARQEERAGWLDEVITGTLIPERCPKPARTWNHELHRGLAARRLARELQRTYLGFTSVKSYEQLPEAEQALAHVTDQALTSALSCHERVAPHERERCRQAWTHAKALRYHDQSN